MSKFMFAILAAATAAAPALAADPITFERDGITYVASVYQKGDVQLIEGHEVQSGRAFTLRVINGRVKGDYAGQPVSYDAPKRSPNLLTASR